MLREYGLKATFYISPQNQEFPGHDLLTPQEIKDLNGDFEIGAHTLTHRSLPTLSEKEAEREIVGSKTILEQITGNPVKTFCYPKGAYTALHVQLVKAAGFRYARTVARYAFNMNDPYQAGTSLHVYDYGFGRDLWRTSYLVGFRPIRAWRCLEWAELGRVMFDYVLNKGGIFHVWGHSWEIDRHNDWDRLQEFFGYISRHPSVKYCTNGELEGLLVT
jgi:peptidoglycan-N-acetylglucosamine deacetylase